MRKFNSPYIADWFAISLRWVAIFALTISVDIKSGFSAIFLLTLLALWNLGLSVMGGLNIRLNYHRQISIFVDIIFSLILFWTQGGLAGVFYGIALLPILSGAIYFEILGSMVAAGVMAVSTLAYAYFFMPAGSIIAGVIGATVTLLLGLLFGFLSHQLIECLRHLREKK